MCGPRPSYDRVRGARTAPQSSASQADKQLAEAVRSMTDPGELTKLVNHPYERVRLRVAANKHAPAGALATLAQDTSVSVVKHVARHRNTAAEVLHALATHQDERVRLEVARHRRTTDATFRFMLDREDTWLVLDELMRSKRCTFEMRAPVLLSRRGAPFRQRDVADPRFDDATVAAWVAEEWSLGWGHTSLGEYVMATRPVSDEIVLGTLHRVNYMAGEADVLRLPRVTAELLTTFVKTAEPDMWKLNALIESEYLNLEALDFVLSSARWASAVGELEPATIHAAWCQFAVRRDEAQRGAGPGATPG